MGILNDWKPNRYYTNRKFFMDCKPEELSKAIRDIAIYNGKARLRVEEAVKEAAKQIASEARRRVPRHTGGLRKSIKARFAKAELIGEAYTKVPYGHLVEFGHRAHTVKPKKKKAMRIDENGLRRFAKSAKIPAKEGHPFLRPAYDYIEPKYIEAVKKAVETT